MKRILEVLTTIGIIVFFVYQYLDKNADGHDSLVSGAHYSAAHPLGVLLIAIGGIGIWFGLKMLSRK